MPFRQRPVRSNASDRATVYSDVSDDSEADEDDEMAMADEMREALDEAGDDLDDSGEDDDSEGDDDEGDHDEDGEHAHHHHHHHHDGDDDEDSIEDEVGEYIDDEDGEEVDIRADLNEAIANGQLEPVDDFTTQLINDRMDLAGEPDDGGMIQATWGDEGPLHGGEGDMEGGGIPEGADIEDDDDDDLDDIGRSGGTGRQGKSRITDVVL